MQNESRNARLWPCSQWTQNFLNTCSPKGEMVAWLSSYSCNWGWNILPAHLLQEPKHATFLSQTNTGDTDVLWGSWSISIGLVSLDEAFRFQQQLGWQQLGEMQFLQREPTIKQSHGEGRVSVISKSNETATLCKKRKYGDQSKDLLGRVGNNLKGQRMPRAFSNPRKAGTEDGSDLPHPSFQNSGCVHGFKFSLV